MLAFLLSLTNYPNSSALKDFFLTLASSSYILFHVDIKSPPLAPVIFRVLLIYTDVHYDLTKVSVQDIRLISSEADIIESWMIFSSRCYMISDRRQPAVTRHIISKYVISSKFSISPLLVLHNVNRPIHFFSKPFYFFPVHEFCNWSCIYFRLRAQLDCHFGLLNCCV